MNDNLQDIVLDLKSRLETLEAKVAALETAPAKKDEGQANEGGSDGTV